RVLQGKAELSGVPGPLLPFVTAALSVDPRSRPTAQALAQRCGAMYARSARDGRAGADGTRIDGTRADGTRIGGYQGWAGYPDPGQHQGRQNGRGQQAPLPGPATAAANVADLLPPVDYGQPGAAGRQAASPAQQAAQREAVQREAACRASEREAAAASVPEGAHTLVIWAIGVIAIALAILLPIAGTLISLGILTLLKAADKAQTKLSTRRSVRGASPGDIGVVIMTAPFTVARAALSTLIKAPIALVIAAIAAAVSVVLLHASTLPQACGWGAGAAVAWYCLGPGSHGPRRQLRRISHGVIRSRAAMTVGLISSWALAAATVSSMLSQPPLVWPATTWMLPHLPSLGASLHSVQQWLLGRAVGMLHLP
ncbi:MAG TPA: hypothetical protein VG164_12935, partial [Trebonia sp.]|nr:hypothetical protein [Trebonia sp.]